MAGEGGVMGGPRFCLSKVSEMAFAVIGWLWEAEPPPGPSHSSFPVIHRAGHVKADDACGELVSPSPASPHADGVPVNYGSGRIHPLMHSAGRTAGMLHNCWQEHKATVALQNSKHGCDSIKLKWSIMH